MLNSNYLSLKEAAAYIGQTTRWLRRHWQPDLLPQGVKVYRVPKWSIKGRLVFDKASLSAYLEGCLIKPA